MLGCCQAPALERTLALTRPHLIPVVRLQLRLSLRVRTRIAYLLTHIVFVPLASHIVSLPVFSPPVSLLI
jgi:hypothetical protein